MRLLRRSARLLIIVAALSLAISASASATTVTVSPGGNVTGTGTTDIFIGGIDCRTATFTARLASGSGLISSNLQLNFANCTLPGIGGATIACTATETLTVTGITASGVTPLTMSNINCTVTVTGLCSARITGSVPTSYSNGARQLTISATGQTIAISGSTCGTLFPNGTATITGPSRANFIYNVTPSTTITAV